MNLVQFNFILHLKHFNNSKDLTEKSVDKLWIQDKSFLSTYYGLIYIFYLYHMEKNLFLKNEQIK